MRALDMEVIMTYLSKEAIKLSFPAVDWKEAVMESGKLLVLAGKATEGYVRAMIEIVQEFGAYMVVAPGLAMPHARPEAGVLETGISFLTLKDPVFFPGREDNPVVMLIALAAESNDVHLDLMESIGQIICDNQQLLSLQESVSENYVFDYFGGKLQ